MKAYFSNALATIIHGDCRDHLDRIKGNCLIADPPYSQTRFKWDKWPEGWLELARLCAPTLWIFLPVRVLLEKAAEFEPLVLAQDLIWEKQNGTSLHNDRFRRVHENLYHFYSRDLKWKEVFHQAVYTMDAQRRRIQRQNKPAHWGQLSKPGFHEVAEGGPRHVRSVIYAKNSHRKSLHPTEKPIFILDYLVRYSCPTGGTVVDCFGGSGSTAVAASRLNIRSITIEADEQYCEVAAKRLSQELQFPR